MSEEQEIEPVVVAKPPLFTLDLGANGGVLAPTSVEELQEWVQREFDFWTWTQNVSTGNHKSALDQAWNPLNSAISQAREAVNYQAQADENAVRQRVGQIQSWVQEVFLNRKLPHSTTALAQRVAALKVDPPAAIAYVFPFLPVVSGNNYPFEGRDLQSWRGFLQGLIEKFRIVSDVEPAIQAEREALEALHERAEQLIGEKKNAINVIHRDFVKTVADIDGAKKAQQTDFDVLMLASKEAHERALNKHAAEMEALRKTFRESMTLRAPVDYWKAKATVHEQMSNSLMKWMFGSMAGLAVLLGVIAYWVGSSLNQGKPDAWKVAVFGLVSVLGVWAVRMVVRMFLSHTHLATDAEERVTMVMTYLALLEGEKMPSDEDRKLVLTPLFRPASDGLVKDEGLPHPMLDLFTRASSK